MKIEIYSTPACHFCKDAKEFFDREGLEYQEYDVASDQEKRKEMVEMTGQMGVPVIRIGDDALVGFDEGIIKEILEKGS